LRPHRLRRPRHPAHGALPHRSRPELGPAVLDADRCGVPARRRRDRTRRRPPLRTPGRHRLRGRGRAVLPLPAQPQDGGPSVSTASTPTRPPTRASALRLGGYSVRLRPRTALAVLGCLLALAAVAAWTTSTGTFELTPDRLWATLAGSGTRAEDYIVWTIRLPRL